MSEDRAGSEAEKLVEELLKNKGWGCMPAKHQRISTDSAEIINMKEDAVRNPDICAIRGGQVVFVEVKQFGNSVSVDVRGQEEHGIRKPKFYDYVKVHQMSGVPLWVFIFEEERGLLLGSQINQLSRLEPIDRESCRDVYGELVTFFPRSDLDIIKLSNNHAPDDFPFKLNTTDGTDVNELLSGVKADIETVQTGLGAY